MTRQKLSVVAIKSKLDHEIEDKERSLLPHPFVDVDRVKERSSARSSSSLQLYFRV
jgi:hypothetical protein